jgi:uncharacterized membrane protein
VRPGRSASSCSRGSGRTGLLNGERETGRVEAFSDGVYAIAITLLILELKVPEDTTAAGFRRHLIQQWPSFLALLTSFATITVMWMNHHMLFGLIQRVDRPLLLFNAWLLLGTSVVPYPTALVAHQLGHEGDRLAAGIYSGTFVFIALGYNLLWRYASSPRRRPPLLRVADDSPEVSAIHDQYRWGPVWYLVALVLSMVNATVSVGIVLALAVFFALPPRRGPDA